LHGVSSKQSVNHISAIFGSEKRLFGFLGWKISMRGVPSGAPQACLRTEQEIP
jgi:hypothetical protein